MNSSKVLISGASGMIGSALVEALAKQQVDTLQLTRSKSGLKPGFLQWDPAGPESGWPGIPNAFAPLDAVICLSGANVAGHRWSESYKNELIESRLLPIRALWGMISKMTSPPKVLLCASATGIYGDRGSEILTEDSASGSGFLADLCRQWEAASKPAEDLGIRVVHLRFGMVLGKGAGVLGKMAPVFKLGLGGKFGSGDQWMSWVTLPDVVRAILFAMEKDDVRGAYNVVSPNPVSNSEFTRSLGEALHRPTPFPVPALALKLAFGQMARETMLASNRVLPARLSAAGFRFEYPEIRSALKAITAP